MQQRHKNIEKVEAFLRKHDAQYEIATFPDTTRTAIDAANAIGCSVEQIAKSLIFREDLNDEPILIVMSGGNRVSLEKFESAANIKLLTADAKFTKHHTGFPIGGVPPLAHEKPVKTFLDNDLLKFDLVWAAAGTPESVFSIHPNELGSLAEGRWLEIKE